MKIIAANKILKANDQIAEQNRNKFTEARVFTVNMLGSPGAGKTTLLEAMLPGLKKHLKPAVIEGDVATSNDAERIEAVGVPSVQVNTDGACHLDANFVSLAADSLGLPGYEMLFIENVGNLICTAGFNLGEQVRMVVLSSTEGDDKVVKYPAMFQRADALVINKTDLYPHINFDPQRVTGDAKRLAPAVRVFQVSAKTGEGVEDVAEWLLTERKLWLDGISK
jgi:hydrogenase nickel incorporation protein HypB